MEKAHIPILRVRDGNGKFVPIEAIKGEDGKSAYEQAKDGGYAGTEEAFIALLNGLTATIDAQHYADLNNPHKVTASQVGLGNVNNTSDANKPVSTAQATAISEAKKAGTDAQSNLNSHTANKNNPHGVTCSQIGAVPLSGGVMSGLLSLSSAPTSDMHAATKKYVDDSLPKKTLLWEGSQSDGSIKLSLSNYDFLIVISEETSCIVATNASTKAYLSYFDIDGQYVAWREVTVTSLGLSFSKNLGFDSDGDTLSISAANEVTKIYGVKL